jgi:uncharacterized protein YjiS (DUF1127 family)
MKESLHGEFRLSWLDHRYNQRRRAGRHRAAVWASSVRPFDRAAQHGWPLWASSDVPFTGRAPARVETSFIRPLTTIGRIVAAIRMWCARARERQQLRELSDHMLKDIGLRREDVGYEFPQPFSHCD